MKGLTLTGRAKVYISVALIAVGLSGALVALLVVQPLRDVESKTQGITEAGPCRAALHKTLSLGAVKNDPECKLQSWLNRFVQCANGWVPRENCSGLHRKIPPEVRAVLEARGGVVPDSGGNSGGQPGPPGGGSGGGNGSGPSASVGAAVNAGGASAQAQAGVDGGGAHACVNGQGVSCR